MNATMNVAKATRQLYTTPSTAQMLEVTGHNTMSVTTLGEPHGIRAWLHQGKKLSRPTGILYIFVTCCTKAPGTKRTMCPRTESM
mmetsp:Transcript_108790/g.216051  ORF Transcript_108790/g.216051 Transcript_108790/m.216051 type:complete len:85 (+) Transcript_108790:33-287(+)